MSKIFMVAIAFSVVIVLGGGCEQTTPDTSTSLDMETQETATQAPTIVDPTNIKEPIVSQKTQVAELVDPKEQSVVVEKSMVDTEKKTEDVDTSEDEWVGPPKGVDVMGDVVWKDGYDPYLGLNFSYPPFYTFTAANFTANDDNGPRWMILTRKLNSGKELRIEVWKLRDMPERPFGITEPGVDPAIVLPKYQELMINGQKYGVYMFLNGMLDFEPEMQAIVDTIK